ncbi:twin-arginine translocation pathway signal protein [Meridianimarinicoccus roseus]|uniref:Twin-arginine translocation pathway signal protein n=1 Tax=Meridianimarinicoccus roseus TaxID=2072018 RepID=A0A2V2LEZ5_9RHOB|nr:molybdopterin cofactor-binding domain-containing protein [Meridianimarinicoccus roseus]PWR02451.1 twin-arginine translocation pathway signal protein [Meridianimarinicoccus roseus]
MLTYLEDLGTLAVRKALDLTVQKVSRRGFLGGSATFALAVYATDASAFERWKTGGTDMPHGVVEDPMVFVSIDADGTVTLVAHRSEMGTGARTSLPMIMADEMEADWDRVVIVQAEGDEPKYGNQNTDGSRSMRHHIQAARKIGGSVRHMLAAAAAERWGVSASEVVVENHVVRHGDKSLGFGDLAEAAMAMPVPAHEDIAYKSPDAFRYTGKGEVQITDLHDITTGKAVYGGDVTVPGMKVAMAVRPPVVGGKVVRFDASEALALPGVVGVYELPHSIPPAGFAPLGGVAVVADDTWTAIKARDLITIEWDDGPHAGYNSDTFMEEMKATALEKGNALRTQGDPDGAFANAARVFGHTYTGDHIAHIAMEPPVALAQVQGGMAEIWAPVQSPYQARTDIAAALEMDVANVKVNVTLLGGGFGRKSKADFATEAALLSKMAGVPVRMQWTREDDVRHSFYHTTSAERIEVALNAEDRVTGWRHNSVAPSIVSTFAPDSGYQFPVENGMGHVDVPFDIANISCENGKAMAHTRIGWFRAVSNVPRAFAIGSFVGELAAELGRDEKEMWLELIGAPRTIDPAASGFPETYWNYGEPPGQGFDIQTGRLAHVLETAAAGIGYGKALPDGEGIGLAVHRSFVSYVGCAAHVKMVDGRITVPELHLAIDCGFAANPERIASQMEGAAVMGMTVALDSSITYRDGAVVQANYYDYDVVRADNFPRKVVTHIVPHDFATPSTGVGEPGLPPIAPAIANAVFKASGTRRRGLPMGRTI